MELYPDLSVKKAYGVAKCYRGKGYIYFGYWKQGMSIYPGTSQGLDESRNRNPRIKTGKGTINLNLGEGIPGEMWRWYLRQQ